MKKISQQTLRAAIGTLEAQKRAGVELADLLRFIPMVGGAAHGVAKPEHGANRGETALYEGAGGAAGGTLGFLGGASVGDQLIRHNNISDPDMSMLKAIAMLGSSLGTAIGTVPGRMLAHRDIPDRAELEKLIKELEAGRKSGGGSNITINAGTADVNPSSGTPLEADRESGDELVNPSVTQEA
jgi:hypothetical protein